MSVELSVVIPVFDTPAPLLGRCLASVAAAAGDGLAVEMVIVDDGGGQATAAELARLVTAPASPGAPAMRLVTHHRNLGLAAARNSGMAAASGDYLMFLDSDDMLVAGSLPGLVAQLRRGMAPVTAFLSVTARDDGPPVLSAAATALAEAGPVLSPHDSGLPALVPSSWAQAYDRAFLIASGLGFDPALRRWEDRVFVVASQLASGRIGVHAEIVHHYSPAPGGITRRRRSRADALYMARHLRTIERLLATDGVGPDYAAEQCWLSLSRLYAVLGPAAIGDRRARRLALGVAARVGAGLPPRLKPPHPSHRIARLPAPVRAAMVGLVRHADTPPAAALLLAAFALIRLVRR